MSNQLGKPMHLTNGERRLLVEVLDKEITCRQASYDEAPETTGEEQEAKRVHRLRIKQYKRIRLEVLVASPVEKSQ